MSVVVTGEAVALDLRPARLPSRALAVVVDFVIQALLLLLLVWLAGRVVADVDEAAAGALLVVAFVVVFLVYPVACETLLVGRTPGKMALGLRVVRDDGGPITFRHAFVRGLFGLVLERPGLLLFGFGLFLGALVQVIDERGRRIGDIVAGTMVLTERIPGRTGWTPQMPPPLAAWASTMELSGLDDRLALSVRQFLGRADQLDPYARESLGQRLVASVAAVTAPPPPPGTPGWAYLSAVLAERRRREQLRLAGPVAAGPPLYGPPGYAPSAYGQAGYGQPTYGQPTYGHPQHHPGNGPAAAPGAGGPPPDVPAGAPEVPDGGYQLPS